MNKLQQIGAINDVPKSSKFPSYKVWYAMLQRVHPDVFKIPYKFYHTYRGTTIAKEWYTYSNFKKWYDTHNPDGLLQIDKDLIGGKEYSPSTCMFISSYMNVALKLSTSKHGLPPGVRKSGKGYIAFVGVGKGEQKYSKTTKTPEEAAEWYRLRKIEQLRLEAVREFDGRVVDMVERFILEHLS